MIKPRTIHIFVSSPGDVADERGQLDVVVQELNMTLRALAPENPLNVELIRFETHTHPDMGRSPQDVVNSQLGEYEIFLGIMWSRFGTPTPVAGSGTEEEFRAAYHGWESRRVPAHILFYFCEEAIPARNAWDGAEQLQQVSRFRNELLHKGLVGSYQSRTTFADTVRPDLIRVLSGILHASQQPSQVAGQAAARASETDLATVRRRIAAVAAEYEETRASMMPGDSRTRRLEVVASKMRTLAQAAYGFLPELTRDSSPGRRLMAISILQVIPDVEYLDWLATRMSTEKPFVSYHSAVALVSAARTLPDENMPAIVGAVARAEAAAAHLRPDSDRTVTLQYARDEIRRRGY